MEKEVIVNYIQDGLSKGFTEEQIRKALSNQNISAQDIDSAFNAFKNNPTTEATQAAPVPTQKQETTQQPSDSETIKKQNKKLKEVKQVKIFLIIVAVLQFVLILFGIYDFFASIGGPDIPRLLSTGLYLIAFTMTIITIVGLHKLKRYAFILGMITGAIILINSLVVLNIIGLIVAAIWFWSFYRIKSVLTN